MMKKSNIPTRSRVQSAFSSNLKSLMSERGVSQRALAEMAEVSPATISDWLTGSQPNNPNAILKLSKALGCDFQWLLTGERSLASKEVTISELFDVIDEPAFSGFFEVQAKRLVKKKQ